MIVAWTTGHIGPSYDAFGGRRSDTFEVFGRAPAGTATASPNRQLTLSPFRGDGDHDGAGRHGGGADSFIRMAGRIPDETWTMPLKVGAVVSDFFMRAPIEETAKALGLACAFIDPGSDVLGAIRAQSPDVLILDLSLRTPSGLELLRSVRADPGLRRVMILGYLNHVEDRLKADAKAAGCDLVVTRAYIAKKLPEFFAELQSASN